MTQTPEERIALVRARAIAWNRAHPERVSIRAKAYYAANRVKIRKYAKIYAQAHRDDNANTQRRWKLAHPWYNHWQIARQRCVNTKNIAYPRYGGRGIQFHLTKEDAAKLWARDVTPEMIRPSIDRIDNDGNYVFDNCRFISISENSRRGSLEMHRRKFRARVEKLNRTLERRMHLPPPIIEPTELDG